jgi:small-conductance mechanosensitive channel
LLLLTLLSAAALIWLVRTLQQVRVQGEIRWLNAALRAGQVGIGALVLSFAANLFGNVALARFLTEGILLPVYLAVLVGAASLILEGAIVIALRTDTAQKLAMVRDHGPLVRRRLLQLVRVAAVGTWALVILRLFSLLGPLVALLQTLLGASIRVGTIAISLGDIVGFGLVVWLSFVVSRFVRFILDEDILPHMPLPRGVPAAASKAVHYVILLVGFFLAIGAAGIDLSRFVVLGGALGVGVGFGLQSVVNNFVSGLILLFERPIQVGDRVQVGDLTGDVRHIGIRATIVKTREGSEVIVPNANLVSKEVINWTLSDPRRRITVPVGVAYGTDPERVIDLLVRAARENSDILENPAPTTLFLGFGESSLDFSLRAWTAQSTNYRRVQSELTLAVNAALVEAGIEIPFPQRDLHVRSADSSAGELVAEPRSQETGGKKIRKLPHR